MYHENKNQYNIHPPYQFSESSSIDFLDKSLHKQRRRITH
jgi:hypothetical protein